MRIINRIPQEIAAGATLGAAALIGHSAGYLAYGLNWAPIGNLALFAAALAYNFRTVLLALAIGLAPLSFITSLHGEVIYSTLLVLSLSLSSRMPQRAIAYLLPPLWCITALYTAKLCGTVPYRLGLLWGNLSVFSRAAGESLLIVATCAALFSPKITSKFGARFANFSLSELLGNALVFIACGALFLPSAFGAARESWQSVPQPFSPASLILLAAAIAFSWLLGRWLAGIILGDSPSIIDTQLLDRINSSGRIRHSKLSEGPSRQTLNSDGVTHPYAADYTEPNLNNQRTRAICAVSADGTVLFMNETFSDYLGLNPQRALGKSIKSVGLPHDLGEQLDGLIQSTLISGSKELEVKINKLPDELVFYQFKSSLAMAQDEFADSAGNEPRSIVIELFDITPSRTVQLSQIDRERKRSLGALVSGMCHSFNNMLTLISGYASQARRGSEAEKEIALQEIIAATKDAAGLVRQLVEFSEIRRCAPQLIDLKLLIADKIPVLSRLVGGSFEIEYLPPKDDATGGTFVECDPALLIQALSNLILHCKETYTAGTGKIWLSLAEESFDETVTNLNPSARAGRFARMTVRDECKGRRADMLARAFNPALWTDRDASTVDISLACVYAIVRAHDGFLVAESHPDKGTTVSIYLPLITRNSADTENLTSERSSNLTDSGISAASTFQAGILVVEDDESIREVVAAMLRTLGYTVTSSKDANEALTLCQTNKFDLVLIDMVMPHIHGLQLVQELHKRHPDVPTLMMTGSNIVPNDARGESLRVIAKPFDIETLARAVRDSLLGRSLDENNLTVH